MFNKLINLLLILMIQLLQFIYNNHLFILNLLIYQKQQDLFYKFELVI